MDQNTETLMARAADLERQAKAARIAAKAAKKQSKGAALALSQKDVQRCEFSAKKKRCKNPSLPDGVMCQKHSVPEYNQQMRKCRVRECTVGISDQTIYCAAHACVGSATCLYQCLPRDKVPALTSNICFTHLLEQNDLDLVKTLAIIEPPPTKASREGSKKRSAGAVDTMTVKRSRVTVRNRKTEAADMGPLELDVSSDSEEDERHGTEIESMEESQEDDDDGVRTTRTVEEEMNAMFSSDDDDS